MYLFQMTFNITPEQTYQLLSNPFLTLALYKLCTFLLNFQIGFTSLVLPFWYRLTRVVPDKVQGP